MKNGLRFRSMVTVAFVLFCVAGRLDADIRDRSTCAVLPDFPALAATRNECFSGHLCRAGFRGDWLDLTVFVSVFDSPANATLSIESTGVNNPPAGSCVPNKNKEREGYVLIGIRNLTGDGKLKFRLSRPGDEEVVTVRVFDGNTFLSRRRDYVAHVNVPVILNLTGRNLDLLELVNPSIGDRFLPGRTETSASVRLTFDVLGPTTLEQRLHFRLPEEPALNKFGGWPTVNVVP